MTMKTLIFTAHPEGGFTEKIAKQYLGTKQTQDINAGIINLYDEEWQLDYLSFSKTSENSVVKKIQQKISEADELVFVFPLWWGEAPAIMKNMIYWCTIKMAIMFMTGMKTVFWWGR